MDTDTVSPCTKLISITPHVEYSSSVGVLGCKINTNSVAYWPTPVDCDEICLRLTSTHGSLTVVKIDSSLSANDVSYNTWNFLATGQYATTHPHVGGAISVEYEFVHASECADILYDGFLPLSAANSMNYLAECLGKPNSWVAQNYMLFNINDPQCKFGHDEQCNLDEYQHPQCPSTLGGTAALDRPVVNIEYGTGNLVNA